MAKSFALWFSLALALCWTSKGYSQECVNGLMSVERIYQLGRVAGNRQSNRNRQQRIIPDITFTCSGTVTKWMFAAHFQNDKEAFPEMQIWRETGDNTGVYTKIHGTTLDITSENNTNIYEYTIPGGLGVQAGDVLGMFEPDNTWLALYYTDTYGPVNYYDNTGGRESPPSGDFDINSDADGSQNDTPLVTVEIVPMNGSMASNCIRSFATMELIEIGVQQSVDDKTSQQRVIPEIKFTCHGFITKWIIAAQWSDEANFPELQTWNSTDGITYTKQGATTFSVSGGSTEMLYYEYSPNPPHEFNDGDVLGVFIPGLSVTRYHVFFEDVTDGPTNYIDSCEISALLGCTTAPGGDSFSITAVGNNSANEVPLLAVEVFIPPPDFSVESLEPTLQPTPTLAHMSTPASEMAQSTSTSSMGSRPLPTPLRTPPPSNSQECVNGLMSAERVRQLGRAAGTLRSDRNKQQRIIPEITFNCSGTVTKWIVAANWTGGKNIPELQIWRETEDGSGVHMYTKIHGTVLDISTESSTQIYEYTIAAPMAVQPGDVLGMFEPDHSRLEMYYTDRYGPVNYYIDTGSNTTAPDEDFDVNAGSGGNSNLPSIQDDNDMPLLSVQIDPTDGTLASDCISSFATMDAIMAGLAQSITSTEEQQRLIPGINFTCHGFIIKWIVAARWRSAAQRANFPELQTWNSTDGITYKKQGATMFSVSGGNTGMTYYEYSPNPPHEFNDGDVLGMFIPNRTRLRLFYERVDSAPVNYIADTGDSTSPPGDYNTTGQRIFNVVPLVTVEVSIPPSESSSAVPEDPTTTLTSANSVAPVVPSSSPNPPQCTRNQECVDGLMSAERVRQLGRVAGDLKSDCNEQQRIIPDIAFTCSGTVTKWIVAGEWKPGPLEVNFPEMQIWRQTAESGVYTKIHGTTLSFSGKSDSQIYEYPIKPIAVQAGDVLGILEPVMSRLEMYYTDTYGPVNYYKSISDILVPLDDGFDVNDEGSGMEAVGYSNDMPLVTVEISPNDGSLASDCISGFATMQMIEIGLQQSGIDRPVREEERQQRLIPRITFKFNGFITKWILAARWESEDDRINFPELQTWYMIDNITYAKRDAITFDASQGSTEVTNYEYTPDPPLEFYAGDILGIFIPDKARFKIIFERTRSAPLNYIEPTGPDVIQPPEEYFSLTGLDTDNAFPVIAVEVYTREGPTDGSPTHPVPAGTVVGISVGLLVIILLLLIAILVVGVVLIRRRRNHGYTPQAQELEENAAYGVAFVDRNVAYGAFDLPRDERMGESDHDYDLPDWPLLHVSVNSQAGGDRRRAVHEYDYIDSL